LIIKRLLVRLSILSRRVHADL